MVNEATNKFIKFITHKLNNLDRRISILSATAREFTRGTADNNLTFKTMLEQDSVEDIQKYYKAWQGDLLLDYFNPRNKKLG